MNILVTGGLGFVGSNLVDELILKGHTVTVIDNLSSISSSIDYKNTNVKYLIEDIKNINNLTFSKKFDVIFHLAALARIQPSFSEPLDYIDVNVNGTAKLCELALKHNALLIYSSSSSINNGKYKTPYTYSKFAGEEVIKTWIQCFNLRGISCRFYNVYGNREPQNGEYATVVAKFIRQYKNSEPLTIVGDGEQRRDFTNVFDIVDGLIAVMNNGTVGDLYQLGSGKNFSIKELADMFPNSKKQFVPKRKGEGHITLADYEDTFTKLSWRAKRSLPNFIKEIMQ